MFEQLIKRENEVFDILRVFIDNNLDFVLIGGYAISAFKHRFSVDADIVINAKDLDKFEDLLKKNNFNKTKSKELDNIYSSKFIRFEKKGEFGISVDILVDGMGIRQTGGAISFDTINANSVNVELKGIEKEIKVKIPIKELLIAMKIQAGRLTDFRDIAALCKNININKVKEFLAKANKEIIERHIRKLMELLGDKGFIDSFKGVFMEKKRDKNKYDIDLNEVKNLGMLLD